jgi:stage V sporulation protein S
VAGAIAGVVREHQHAEVQAIGASAINQAVKAIALAKIICWKMVTTS